MKYILNMTDEEIKSEIRYILNDPDLEPQKRDKLGFIADNQYEYATNGLIDENKLIELYNSSKYINNYIMTLAINSLRNRKADLFDLINEQNWNDTVLDYGSGTGTHGIACCQNGAEVYFYDVSEKMMMVTIRRLLIRQLHKINIIKNTNAVGENFFDTIICTDVMEHVLDPVKVLKDFIKWLKVGGIAHIHISRGVSHQRGHLPEAIYRWDKFCLPLLEKHFKKESKNNYRLIKK